MYTKEDIKKLFDKEKVLAGDKDVMPEYKAIEIFGKDAVEFAKKLEKGRHSNQYGIGNFQFLYLYYSGVEIAATYVNICIIRDIIAEKNGIRTLN